MIEAMVCGSATWIPMYFDGSDGQEDELDDVRNGKLDPPTNSEGKGEIFAPNKVDPNSKDTDTLEESLRRAGLKPLP